MWKTERGRLPVTHFLWLLVMWLTSPLLYAQTSLPDTIQALATHEHIILDGDMNEPDWQMRKIPYF